MAYCRLRIPTVHTRLYQCRYTQGTVHPGTPRLHGELLYPVNDKTHHARGNFNPSLHSLYETGVATGMTAPLSLHRTVAMLHNCMCCILDWEFLRVFHIVLSGCDTRGRKEETPCCALVTTQAKPWHLFCCHWCSYAKVQRSRRTEAPEEHVSASLSQSFPHTLCWITPSSSSVNMYNFPQR